MTACEQLSGITEPALQRLDDLSESVIQAPTRCSVTVEATCLEALALVRPALVRTYELDEKYAELFNSRDPAAVLRLAGAVFTPDGVHEDTAQDLVFKMSAQVRWNGALLESHERCFKAILRRIRRHNGVEGEGDEPREARPSPEELFESGDWQAAALELERRMYEDSSEEEDEGEENGHEENRDEENRNEENRNEENRNEGNRDEENKDEKVKERKVEDGGDEERA